MRESRRSKKDDYYYNGPDVFMPVTYRNEQPEHDDYCVAENVYVLIHPKELKKQSRTRRFQLAKLIDSKYKGYYDCLTVSLAYNGNYVRIPSYNIMAFAHPEDIELWRELYGEPVCDYMDKSDFIYDEYELEDAIKDLNPRKQFFDYLEYQLRKKNNWGDNVIIEWADEDFSKKDRFL